MAEKPLDSQAEEQLPDAQSETAVEAPKGALDPELVKLPPPKTRIRPIMAIAIIGMCLTLSLRLFSDLGFSRQSETPVTVSSIDELGSDLENRYIEVEVRPDRPQALRLIPSGKTSGQVLVPVLGSGQRLWILLPATPWTGDAPTNERHRGRLVKMRDLDFHSELQSRLKSAPPVPRPISLTEVRSALASETPLVRDAAGDEYPVHADTFVRYHAVSDTKVRIVAVRGDSLRDEAAWSLALRNAGILPQGQGPVASTPTQWTYDVPAPGGFAEMRQRLQADPKLQAADASEITSTREGTWAELSLDGNDILLGNPEIGFEARSISLGISRPLPADAYLINTTEEPGTYWYVMLLVGFFALFALLFAFGLYRRLIH